MAVDKKKVMNAWLKINLQLHNSLETLKELDKQQEDIKKLINNNAISKEEFDKLLEDSLQKYQDCLANVKRTKKLSEELKNFIDKQN